MIFAGIALKLEKVGPVVSSFNSCSSLPLDDRTETVPMPNYILDHYFWIPLMRRQV